MRTSSFRLLPIAFLVLLALALAPQVQAQTVVKANVPFAFSLGGQTFPSGVYSFTIGNGPGSKIVLVSNRDGSKARFLQADVTDESGSVDTLLRFRRYGNNYLLASLSVGGDDISLQFAPSRLEREMMLRTARGEAVTVLAAR